MLAYHKSRWAGKFSSTAMRGRPIVRRPVLMLLRKLMPVRAAITMILRPYGRNCGATSLG